MRKINYVESPSYGKLRALFFKENYVRIKGKWYSFKNKQITEVYGGVQRLTFLIQEDQFTSKRLYFYKRNNLWTLDNNVTFNKKIK